MRRVATGLGQVVDPVTVFTASNMVTATVCVPCAPFVGALAVAVIYVVPNVIPDED